MAKQIKRKFNTILKPSKLDYAPLAKTLLEEYEKWQAVQPHCEKTETA